MNYPSLHIILRRMRAEGDQLSLALFLSPLQEGFEVDVMPDIHILPIVKPGSFQILVIQMKAKGVDQMQGYLRSPAQAGNIARIGRDFGLIENDMKRRIYDSPLSRFCNVAAHRSYRIGTLFPHCLLALTIAHT